MKRKLVLALALIAALSLIAAAPATAEGPNHDRQSPSGDQIMILNQEGPGAPFGYYGCDEMSWFGTIEIDGKTFGMALYPDYSNIDLGTGVMEYGEWWKIFTGMFNAKDGVLKRCAPGRVVMAGYDEGTADMFGGRFVSSGTVDYAAGHFKWWDDYAVDQDGTMGPVSVAGIEGAFGFHGFFETYLP